MWELATNPSRSDQGRRHSSSASSSSQSTEDNSNSSRGRRSRPSVASISAQLPTVREQKVQRALSWKAEGKPPGGPRLDSDETVISSKKVLTDFRKVASRDPDRDSRRRDQLNRYRAENSGQREVYNRLKSWAEGHLKRSNSLIPSWALMSSRIEPLPKQEELLALARHYYPPRVSD